MLREEIDRVLRQRRWPLVRVQREGTCDSAEIVRRERVRNDEDPEVGVLVGVALEREQNEVIAVTRDEAPLLGDGPLQLLGVRRADGTDLVSAH